MRKIDQDLLKNIFNEIKQNECITQIDLSIKYRCNERTIRRYIKILKDNNKIKIKGTGRKRKWVIIN